MIAPLNPSGETYQNPRKFSLFDHVTKTIVYPANTPIFRQGDEGHTMFAIKRGKVAIIIQGNQVDTLGDHEIFGEMALIDHKSRAAEVRTLEETEIVEIDEPHFLFLVQQNPTFALQMMRLLSERLRHTNALLIERTKATQPTQ